MKGHFRIGKKWCSIAPFFPVEKQEKCRYIKCIMHCGDEIMA